MNWQDNNEYRPDQPKNETSNVVKLALLLLVVVVLGIGSVVGSIYATVDRWHECRAAGHSKLYCYLRDVAGH